MKRTVKLLLIVSAIFSICAVVYGGGSISDLKKQRQEIQAQSAAKDELLKEVRSEKNSLLSEIDALDEELTIVTDDLFAIGNQIDLAIIEIDNTTIELEEATEKREVQYSAYKKRVRSQYINGTVGYLDVILKSDDVIDFLNRVEYVNRIVESDKAMADRLTQTENLISEKLNNISAVKREMEELSVKYGAKQAELESAKRKKLEFLGRLGADEERYLQQIRDLQADDVRIEKLIKDAEAAEAKRLAEEKAKKAASAKPAVAYYQGGKLGWPVPSSNQITSAYVSRSSPISGKLEFHTGIDIPASYGASVVAAEGGVVISAGWNGGFGNAVIISHGNGLSTLYGHNSKLLVKNGDVVKRGQAIAQIGSTGYSTGNHLHFEVRINGAHTNPIPYLK